MTIKNYTSHKLAIPSRLEAALVIEDRERCRSLLPSC